MTDRIPPPPPARPCSSRWAASASCPRPRSPTDRDADQSDVQQRSDRDIVVTGERERARARIAQGDRASARHAADRHRDQRPDAAPPEPADPARRARPPCPASPSAPARAAAAMATRSTCAAIRRATTSPWTASATAPSTAAPTRSTCSRSKSTTAPIRCSTARASVGGTINLVSKMPQARRPHHPLGRDRHRQLLPRAPSTPTSGSATSSRSASTPCVHRNDVPGRDVEEYQRWGVAPAITFGIGRPTSLTLAYRPPARRQHADLRRPLLPQPAQRRAAARGRRQRLFRLSQPRRAGDRRSTG